ncbi:MAG: UDP-N-acetylmuramate--L-alanine ligase [Bacteroidales bacterium]
MRTNDIHSIYFLGIGGIGMSALARYFLWQGKSVSGYDRTETSLTHTLEAEGAKIHYREEPQNIPVDIDIAVYTPAIPATNKEFAFLRKRNIRLIKRAEMLGMISSEIPAIAIAGTHGKTTVTTILAHIFKTAGAEFSAFMGGISTNYDTNFIGSENPKWIIAEADEYDRSFLHLKPHIALITSMDSDHLDVYGSFQNLEESFKKFAGNVVNDGRLILHQSLQRKGFDVAAEKSFYGLQAEKGFTIEDIKLSDTVYECVISWPENKHTFCFHLPGRHNLENALAAVSAAITAGLPWELVKKALETYKGVKRRFEVHVNRADIVFIDDYAHHPSEIKACISAAREFFPGRKITGVFQPHLYSRTRDFADGFAETLEKLDEIILLPIYPARELPIEGVSSDMIFNKIKNNNKFLMEAGKLMEYLNDHKPDVLITMGAGNIDQYVLSIKERLEK